MRYAWWEDLLVGLTMTTHFITAEIDLQATPTELQKAIAAELKKQGEPLRWAITAVDETQAKVTVEAVVTTNAPSITP